MSAACKIAVFHSHAHYNFGDVLMLRGLCQWIAANIADAEIAILSMKGMVLEEDEQRHSHWYLPGPEMPLRRKLRRRILSRLIGGPRAVLADVSVSEWFLRWKDRLLVRSSSDAVDEALKDLLASVNLVLFSGNGYLNDGFPDHVIVAERLSRLADGLGIPCIATGQGVGPIRSRVIGDRVRRHLARCASAWVREPLSGATAHDVLGLDLPVAGDDALLSLPEPNVIATPETQQILVHHRYRDRRHCEPHLRNLGALLGRLAVAGTGFVGVPMAWAAGGQDAQAISACFRIAGVDDPELRCVYAKDSLQTTFHAAAAGIGISYHFCVLCAHFGLPIIGLYESDYYQHKLFGVAEMYQLGPRMRCLSYSEAASLPETELQQWILEFGNPRHAGRARSIQQEVRQRLRRAISTALPGRLGSSQHSDEQTAQHR